jgi:cell division septation protein DedD
MNPRPSQPAPVIISPQTAVFSVPVINKMERGEYYLQLGAFNRAEAVENALSKIEQFYPRKVEVSGSPDQPVYRILLGPVNQGEGGALLQRFKGSGYTDAYLRNN